MKHIDLDNPPYVSLELYNYLDNLFSRARILNIPEISCIEGQAETLGYLKGVDYVLRYLYHLSHQEQE